MADKVFSKNKKLANRYVQLARKIQMKIRVRMPKGYKRKYCKHCYSYLRPGVNCRVRVDNKIVSYKCFNCKKYGHYKSECRSKRIGGQKFHAKVASSVDRFVESNDEHGNALLFTCDASVENQKNVWYLDT